MSGARKPGRAGGLGGIVLMAIHPLYFSSFCFFSLISLPSSANQWIVASLVYHPKQKASHVYVVAFRCTQVDQSHHSAACYARGKTACISMSYFTREQNSVFIRRGAQKRGSLGFWGRVDGTVCKARNGMRNLHTHTAPAACRRDFWPVASPCDNEWRPRQLVLRLHFPSWRRRGGKGIVY